MSGPEPLLIIVLVLLGAIGLGVAIALFIAALKMTGGIIKALVWLVKHVVGFAVGIVGDAARLVGAIVAAIVAVPFATANVILGRWPKADRWGRALRRELLMTGYCAWSILVRRPLKLLCLDGVVQGVEERLPEADRTATRADVPSPGRAGGPSAFEGYRIDGGLRPGGSGAKLYIATPEPARRAKLLGNPARVVIKSFALEEGSSLPQIVRESRALDAARQLGLVLDHGLDESRFWYAMPYHAGVTLNEATRVLHARAGSEGLAGAELAEGLSFVRDLASTLVRYHEGGLWHKDVKPDNVIVHDGRAHLVDLGLVTPLRSAMTLTTHGTEYFRDPEMVRQALRGVRVHQVDGAKFDVYGVGAVLYFVLENTFPAHGGLSAFERRSPEALRWIVRRAMADYHQRYDSTEAMLRDLEAVAAAGDPWTMRPVELPSMRGGASLDESIAAGAVHGGRKATALPPLVDGARPRLVVTDWWRGAYASPDVAERVLAAAGRAAVEAKRPRPKRERRDPPRFVAVLGIVLLAMGSIVLFGREFGQRGATKASSAPSLSAVARALPATSFVPPDDGASLLVVSTHPAPADPEVVVALASLVEAYEARGFNVVRDDPETAAKIALELMKAKSRDASGTDTVELDAALAAAGYFGAIHVDAAPGGGRPVERLTLRLVGSEAAALDAAARSAEAAASSAGESSRKTKSSRRAIRVKHANAVVLHDR